MGYSNPFQAMQQMTQQMQQMAPQMMPMRQPTQIPPVNPEQLRQYAMTLNDQSLAQFVQLARQRGISEQDIQSGIQILRSL